MMRGMAEGEAVPGSRVRIRFDGDPGDADALKAWLEREEWLGARVREGKLRIVEQPGADGGREHMGGALEVVVQVLAATASLTEIVRNVQLSVQAWRANSNQVDREDTPDPRVDPLEPDQD